MRRMPATITSVQPLAVGSSWYNGVVKGKQQERKVAFLQVQFSSMQKIQEKLAIFIQNQYIKISCISISGTKYFQCTTEIQKYLGRVLSKYIQTFKRENYEVLIKPIKNYLDKWRELICSCKDSISPILNSRFCEFPTKIPKWLRGQCGAIGSSQYLPLGSSREHGTGF